MNNLSVSTLSDSFISFRTWTPPLQQTLKVRRASSLILEIARFTTEEVVLPEHILDKYQQILGLLKVFLTAPNCPDGLSLDSLGIYLSIKKQL